MAHSHDTDTAAWDATQAIPSDERHVVLAYIIGWLEAARDKKVPKAPSDVLDEIERKAIEWKDDLRERPGAAS